MPTRARLIIAIIIAFSSTVLMVSLVASTYNYFDLVSDLPEYVVAGHLMVEGRGSKMYDGDTVIAERKKLFPTMRERSGVSVLSPPPAFPLFVPFGLPPVDIAKRFWPPLLGLATAISVLFLGKALKLSARETAWLWATTFCLGPLLEALKLGQISAFLLLSFSSSILLFKRNRDYSAGAVLALFVLKPQELVTFMLFLLGAGRWKAIKGFTAMMAFLGVTSILTAGSGVYADFFAMAHKLKTLDAAMLPGMTATVRGQLTRLDLSRDLVQTVSLLVLLCACIFSFWWGKRQAKKEQWLESGVAVTLPLGLTTAMLVHFYDLILLVPAGITLIKSPIVRSIPKLFQLPAMLMIISLTIPVAGIIHYRYVLSPMPINPYAVMMIITSLALCIFGVSSELNQQAPPESVVATESEAPPVDP